MIRPFVPGGARLGPCPACKWGGTVEIMSRAYYRAYTEWVDGKITGRCTACGYERSACIGRGRGEELLRVPLPEGYTYHDMDRVAVPTSGVINVGASVDSQDRVKKLADSYDFIYGAVGLRR